MRSMAFELEHAELLDRWMEIEIGVALDLSGDPDAVERRRLMRMSTNAGHAWPVRERKRSRRICQGEGAVSQVAFRSGRA